MLSLATITNILAESPKLGATFNYNGLVTYVNLVRILQTDLLLYQGINKSKPPEHLPVSTHDFLKLCLGLDNKIAKLAWATLC